MHTILGSGGPIGIETAKALKGYKQKIRLVSRHPQKVNPDDELFSADLTRREQVMKAVEGSEVVYLLAGFPYNAKVWRATWPVVMRNVIEVCKTHAAKLVFFDNIYMYNPEYLWHMTEETPFGPVSQKGVAREQVAHMLLEEIEKGDINALFARSADFYGPSIKGNSVLTETVFNKLAKGKKAIWMISTDYKHSYTYTPDAGKATAILGNCPEAFNQVWHLPTASNPLTGHEWIETIAGELGVLPKVMRVSAGMVRFLGMFNPMMKEFVEMLYHYDRDYIFDSRKFEKRFNYLPSPYVDGIKEIIRRDYKK